MRQVVVFDALDAERESTSWAGLLGGLVHRDAHWHSIVADGGWGMGVQRAPNQWHWTAQALRRRRYRASVWSRLLLLPPLLLSATGCAADAAVRDPESRYSYGSPKPSPRSGLDGKATVEVNGFTFVACPALAVGQETPLIEDSCLTPGDAGASTYGDYSMLEPSKTCADGRLLTDAGGVGLGFVGEPLIGSTQPSPDRAAALDCLWGLDR